MPLEASQNVRGYQRSNEGVPELPRVLQEGLALRKISNKLENKWIEIYHNYDRF
jgi:hypothetical protein